MPGVNRYFEVHHRDWDDIYSAPAGSWRWRVNRHLRNAVWTRMARTLEAFSNVTDHSVLDVGCGTGELGIRLAERGAARVLGIDAADSMVGIAAAHAIRRGVAAACEFVRDDFLSHDFGPETFEYPAALGVLDYVDDAAGLLGRLWSLTRTRMVVSLPEAVPPRCWLRRAWHGLHGSRLYYYTRADAGRLATRLSPAALWALHSIPGSDRTHLLVCDVSPGARP